MLMRKPDSLVRAEALIAHMQSVELILGSDERSVDVISFSAFRSKIIKLFSPLGDVLEVICQQAI